MGNSLLLIIPIVSDFHDRNVRAWLTQAVSNYLDHFQKNGVISCQVNKISLISYTASEIGGRLTTIAHYDLERAEIKWHEVPLFD